MSQQAISWDSPSVISSPASVDGPTLCDSPAGQTIAPCGLAPVRANLSAKQAKAAGLLTSGTYGPRGSTSSVSAALRSSLVNRLKQRLPMAGLILFKMTWKESATPSRRSVSLLRASVLRISGTGCGSWPTPCSQDGPNGGPAQGSDCLPGCAVLATWPTAQARDHFPAHSPEYIAEKKAQGHGMANLNDVVQLASWPTPTVGNATGSQAAKDASPTGRRPDGSKATVALPVIARLAHWPTTTTTDAIRKPYPDFTTKNITLNHAAIWATPCRRDYRFANRLSFKARGGGHEGRAIEQPSGSPLAGFWSGADWLDCTDGKARPVESGTFPLAPRLPNHVGRLRAYGNAIVPQVAAEVIGAFMNYQSEQGD